MIIIPATKAHIEQIAAIERLSLPAPWGESLLSDCLNNPQVKFYCATDERVRGFFVMYVGEEEAHLTSVAVQPDSRKQGIGRKLIEFAVNLAHSLDAERILLEVRVSNRPAINLYLAQGFRVLGERKNFYSDGESALIMDKIF